MELPTRSGFDTSACRPGDCARELEVVRQLGATPPALLARPQHRGRVERHDDRHRELGQVVDLIDRFRGPFEPEKYEDTCRKALLR